LIGMWKAFQELVALGWLDDAVLPRMVAVQASGCAPIVRAFEQGADEAERWDDAHTLAAGIRVPMAVGDRLMLSTLRASGGTAIAVDEDAIVRAWKDLASEHGLLLCPEGAATYAACRALRSQGWITPDDEVLLFNCATGLKYPLPAM
jgi:threonine synthase